VSPTIPTKSEARAAILLTSQFTGSTCTFPTLLDIHLDTPSPLNFLSEIRKGFGNHIVYQCQLQKYVFASESQVEHMEKKISYSSLSHCSNSDRCKISLLF
jgi:hypothetical protein